MSTKVIILIVVIILVILFVMMKGSSIKTGAAELFGGCFGGRKEYDEYDDYDKYGAYEDDGEYGGGFPRLKVSDPEYTHFLKGKKTLEVRPYHPPYSVIFDKFNETKRPQDVTIVRARPMGDTSEYPGGKYKFDAKVVRATKYKNIEAAFKTEKLADAYPERKLDDAIKTFKTYLPQGYDADKGEVLVFEIKQ